MFCAMARCRRLAPSITDAKRSTLVENPTISPRSTNTVGIFTDLTWNAVLDGRTSEKVEPEQIFAQVLVDALDLASFEQLLSENRIPIRKRSDRVVAHQASHVHFHFRVQIVGMMENQTFRNCRQPWRAPLRQREMGHDE